MFYNWLSRIIWSWTSRTADRIWIKIIINRVNSSNVSGTGCVQPVGARGDPGNGRRGRQDQSKRFGWCHRLLSLDRCPWHGVESFLSYPLSLSWGFLEDGTTPLFTSSTLSTRGGSTTANRALPLCFVAHVDVQPSTFEFVFVAGLVDWTGEISQIVRTVFFFQ